MYLKKNIVLVLCWVISLPVFSAEVNHTAASLGGYIGAVDTPIANAIANKSGNVGIWKNSEDNRLDSLYLSYGLRNWLEVGLNSVLLENNRTDFLFKVNSRVVPISRKLPVLAFGVGSFDSYVVASYAVYPVQLSVGGMLNESKIFASLNMRVSQYLLLQAEIKNNVLGLGLRGQLNKLQLSLLYQDDNNANNKNDGRWFFGVSLHM